MFCTPFVSLLDEIVPALMSAFWIVPFLICELVITVAATALPAQAATSAAIEMTSAGLGRRSFMEVLPLEIECLRPDDSRCGGHRHPRPHSFFTPRRSCAAGVARAGSIKPLTDQSIRE